MPVYAYTCTACDHQFEQRQSFSDPALTICPECEGALRKVFNSVGIVFKGSGFYRTDSRDSGRNGSKSPSRGERTTDSSSGDSSSSDSSSSDSGAKVSGSNGSSRDGSSESRPSAANGAGRADSTNGKTPGASGSARSGSSKSEASKSGDGGASPSRAAASSSRR